MGGVSEMWSRMQLAAELSLGSAELRSAWAGEGTRPYVVRGGADGVLVPLAWSLRPFAGGLEERWGAAGVSVAGVGGTDRLGREGDIRVRRFHATERDSGGQMDGLRAILAAAAVVIGAASAGESVFRSGRRPRGAGVGGVADHAMAVLCGSWGGRWLCRRGRERGPVAGHGLRRLRSCDRGRDRAEQEHREQQGCDDALHDPQCGRERPEDGLRPC